MNSFLVSMVDHNEFFFDSTNAVDASKYLIQLRRSEEVSKLCIGEPVRANNVGKENMPHQWPKHRDLEHLVCNLPRR